MNIIHTTHTIYSVQSTIYKSYLIYLIIRSSITCSHLSLRVNNGGERNESEQIQFSFCDE